MAGTTVSAMAKNVIHCAGVRTSPACTGGKGASSGAMRSSSALVIVTADGW